MIFLDLMLLDKILLTYYEKLPNCLKGMWLKDSHYLLIQRFEILPASD